MVEVFLAHAKNTQSVFRVVRNQGSHQGSHLGVFLFCFCMRERVFLAHEKNSRSGFRVM